jgi:hypothetical protein
LRTLRFFAIEAALVAKTGVFARRRRHSGKTRLRDQI